ncbi:MAG TPA: hypothetical protein DCS30_01200 [Rhizobiales bacterium]|nr:hypothetical protein [Hyphomicrobiales bacterium]
MVFHKSIHKAQLFLGQDRISESDEMGNENRAFIQAKPRPDFSRQGFVQAVKLVSVFFPT